MTNRIRILTVIDSLGVGGAEALLPTFLRHVDHTRFDIRVLALDTVAANHIQCYVRDHCSALTQWDRRRLLSIGRMREIMRAIDEHDADLVHTHLLYSNVQATIAARLAGRPAVATLHNVYPARRKHSSLIKRWVEVAALRATNTRALAVADEVRRAYCGRLGLSPQQVTVIPNAIDLNRFEHQSPDAVARTREDVLDGACGPLLVAVGRIVPQKGYPVLVRAAAELRHRYPYARVVIAGRLGEDRHIVTREIERLELSETVRLLGERDDVPQLLAAADVYVMPSLWEGAPIALLEAMAAGAPVVATSVGGVPEIIRDGENGLLVPCGDESQLAEALLRVLDDRELAKRLAERGRETVREYGADSWAGRIEREYLHALGNVRHDIVTQVAQ